MNSPASEAGSSCLSISLPTDVRVVAEADAHGVFFSSLMFSRKGVKFLQHAHPAPGAMPVVRDQRARPSCSPNNPFPRTRKAVQVGARCHSKICCDNGQERKAQANINTQNSHMHLLISVHAAARQLPDIERYARVEEEYGTPAPYRRKSEVAENTVGRRKHSPYYTSSSRTISRHRSPENNLEGFRRRAREEGHTGTQQQYTVLNGGWSDVLDVLVDIRSTSYYAALEETCAHVKLIAGECLHCPTWRAVRGEQVATGQACAAPVDYLLKRVRMLRHYGVKPWVVLDGRRTPMKVSLTLYSGGLCSKSRSINRRCMHTPAPTLSARSVYTGVAICGSTWSPPGITVTEVCSLCTVTAGYAV